MKKIILVLVGLCCPLFSFGSNPVGFDCAAKNGTFMISFLKGNLGDKEYKLGILVGHKIENRKFEDSFVYPISTSDFEAFQKTKS